MTIGSPGDATDWVWPLWLDRQLDSASPAWSPGQPLPGATNVTARNWTAIGNLDSRLEATVDPRGLVTPFTEGRGWSLDWWVGADDRWHLPSREPAVRQRLLQAAPVVETAMRVPGGDAVHRAYAVRDAGRELVVVEVENRSAAPLALALAIRPCGTRALAAVRRIALADETIVVVDGRVAMWLPRRPNRAAGSVGGRGDVARLVLDGDAGDALEPLDDPDGLASAAFVWPVPHRTSLRVVLPLAPPAPKGGRIRRRKAGPTERSATFTGSAPTIGELPGADQVANGWRVHRRRGLQLALPDDRLADAFDATRGQLLVGFDRVDVRTPRDTVWLAGALDRSGLAAEVRIWAASLPERWRSSGHLGGSDHGIAGDGAALHALADHWRLHRDRGLAVELAPTVGAVAEAIGRASGRRRGLGLPIDELLWSTAAMAAAGEVLVAGDEAQAGADAGRLAGVLRARLDHRRNPDGTRPALAAIAGWPLRVVSPDDDRLAPAVDRLRGSDGDVGVVVAPDDDGQGGYDVVATIERAVVELETGASPALERLRWLLDVASATWTWPTVVHPRLRSGAAGDGNDMVAAAGLQLFVRQLLVRESTEGLALLSRFPDTWLGQPVEVHDAPTDHGTISYALRWHGERPALLWELVPHDASSTGIPAPGTVLTAPGPVITAPGLDPSWSTTSASGEALLAPVPVPSPSTRVGLSPRRR
jgi:hypothetical protein